MAFNFNWSPLTADAEFYSKAQEMLTAALNKSPKPPIIVDDILVNELNLGSVPPELEILEIGDLAEDRFRGIFKMCYSGDAFLTLKTRVQANPLNTYLFSKPSFTSPQPLAAASGLTIPLQITLSDFKMSAFIILVFSKQKGLTLVFRNDPLESLKVSSTFDSIPFVRDYLQKEIEAQLRTLMMDELPAIIHRLSLRLWCPEYAAKEEQEMAQTEHTEEELAVDPLSSPPQDAVDARGNVLDANEISSLSLDGGSEVHSLFSQRSLLRLATLRDSHKTLSLFTPSIPDAVFRAWAGPSERESNGSSTPATPSLTRSHTYHGSTSTTYTFNPTRSSDDGNSLSSRPSLISVQSATTGLSLGAGRHRAHGMRKKKNRVVNLRKSKTSDDVSESGDSEASSVVAASEPTFSTNGAEEPEDSVVTPPLLPTAMMMNSPAGRVRFRTSSIDLEETPRRHRLSLSRPDITITPTQSNTQKEIILEHEPHTQTQTQPILKRPTMAHTSRYTSPLPIEKPPLPRTNSNININSLESQNQTPGILEQAWILKMASEIAQRAHSVKESRERFWSAGSSRGSARGSDDGLEVPPPAYEEEVQ